MVPYGAPWCLCSCTCVAGGGGFAMCPATTCFPAVHERVVWCGVVWGEEGNLPWLLLPLNMRWREKWLSLFVFCLVAFSSDGMTSGRVKPHPPGNLSPPRRHSHSMRKTASPGALPPPTKVKESLECLFGLDALT